MREINKIIVHCSDTPDERDVHAEDIHDWHLDNGWYGIGYHDVITRQGMVEKGRPYFWVGSHCRGHNSASIGVCLVGRDVFTKLQLNTLRYHLIGLLRLHPNAEILGHCDLDSKKTCPNFDVKQWWESVND